MLIKSDLFALILCYCELKSRVIYDKCMEFFYRCEYVFIIDMTKKINIKLPIDLLELTGLSSERLEEKSLLIWVLELYSEGKITLFKAANLAHLKVDNFLSEFKRWHLKHIGCSENLQQAQNDQDVIHNLIKDQ